jgi:hypothetical protein
MIEETLKVIATLSRLQPIEALPERLNTLFARLGSLEARAEAPFIEDEIWSIWTAHADPAAEARMNDAIAAVAGRKFGPAQALLDDLVHDHPLWPEAWNKRATLFFLRCEDASSVRDIRRTLQLEPRHFGALSGFVQICLRRGETVAAHIAAEAALQIHPHHPQLRQWADHLHRLHPPVRH